MMALQARDQNSGEGQVVDVALYESMFNLLEAVIPEYNGADIIRQPSGTTVTGIVPTNTLIDVAMDNLSDCGNGDSILDLPMQAIGRDDMADDQKFATNADRVVYEAEIDAVLKVWCASHRLEDALTVLERIAFPKARL